MQKSDICFVAGRSGGHIVPALTLAQNYIKENPDAHIMFFSTNTNVDKSLLAHKSIINRWIPISLGNFPHNKIHKYPLFLWQLSIAFLKSFLFLFFYKPKKIIAMGGYISIPVCIAARILRIPQEIFELNVVPGKATTFLISTIPQIDICFKQATNYLPAEKCCLTDYPVRFSPSATTIPRKEALAAMTFLTARSTLMILGGSQGSAFINKTIKQWLTEHPELHSRIQIIHQTGLLHDKYDLEDFYIKHSIPAFVFDYFDELENCYQAADLVICRSGAGTLFETKFFNKLCITIPLQTGTTDHQLQNAQAMKESYPALFTVIPQHEIEKNIMILTKTINQLLKKY